MVDFGANALAALRRLGREPEEIEGFALTHLHGDHLGGFPFLLIDGMFNRIRSKPIRVVGPVRSEEKISSFLETAYAEIKPEFRPYQLEVTEIEPDAESKLAGAVVKSYPAQHMSPPDRPLSLRIVAPDGRYVSFSGDTEINDRLLEAAHGAELLVAECSGMRPPIGRHCSWQEWTTVLPTVGAKRVLFSHLNSEVRAMAPELVKTAPIGPPIQFADDGLIVEL